MGTERDYDDLDVKRWARINKELEERYPDVDFDDWNSEIADQLLDGKSNEEIIENIRNAEIERLTKTIEILKS
jgi:hypothetical protein